MITMQKEQQRRHQILLVRVENRLQFDSVATKKIHHDTIEGDQVEYCINSPLRPGVTRKRAPTVIILLIGQCLAFPSAGVREAPASSFVNDISAKLQKALLSKKSFESNHYG